MTLATQHIMRIAAVLALTAASASAFAQSDEYRRGYAEGYAAGQRASHNDRGNQGWARVHVEEAEYGVRGATCDAREAVHNQVERNDNTVRASNRLCGDPAPGALKVLRIVYRCGDSAPARVSVREDESLRLICRR